MKKLISLAAIAMVLLAACSKEETEEVKKVIDPEGIVLISHPDMIVAGDSVAIRLRVNPSTARLTKENITLDCLSSTVYEAQVTEEEQKYIGTKTRATDETPRIPYIQNNENYSIADVIPDSLDNEVLEGQYIVLIKAQSEKNIIDRSILALACNYVDENGETAYISSETFEMTQIPQPNDAIFAWSPQSQSLHTGSLTPTADSVTVNDDKINAVKWYLLARTYKEAATGAIMKYDYDKYISDVKIQVLKDSEELACEQGKTDFDGVYSGGLTEMRYAIPDAGQEPFKTLFEQGSDKKYETFTNNLVVTDKYGHVGMWSQNLNYVIPLQITYKVDIPEDVTEKNTYPVLNKFETLAEYGIDSDIISRYPSLNLETFKSTNTGGLRFIFTLVGREDGFGAGSIFTAPGGDKTIKSEVICSRVYAVWYVKGIGTRTNAQLENYLNIVERFTPAYKSAN